MQNWMRRETKDIQKFQSFKYARVTSKSRMLHVPYLLARAQTGHKNLPKIPFSWLPLGAKLASITPPKSIESSPERTHRLPRNLSLVQKLMTSLGVFQTVNRRSPGICPIPFPRSSSSARQIPYVENSEDRQTQNEHTGTVILKIFWTHENNVCIKLNKARGSVLSLTCCFLTVKTVMTIEKSLEIEMIRAQGSQSILIPMSILNDRRTRTLKSKC